MLKTFAKLQQRVKEATHKETDITNLSKDFKTAEKTVDVTESTIKDLLSKFAILLQPNPTHRSKFTTTAGAASKLTGGVGKQRYPQQEEVLANALDSHATALEADDVEPGIFSRVLRDSAGTYRSLASARDDLDYSIKSNVFENWQSVLTFNMKEIRDGRSKLNSRRIFYDHLRDKNFQTPEKMGPMELETARNKLEEQVRQVDTCMETVLCNDLDRAVQMKHIVDAQLEYMEKCARSLRELSSKIDSQVKNHQPRKPKTFNVILINKDSSHSNSNSEQLYDSVPFSNTNKAITSEPQSTSITNDPWASTTYKSNSGDNLQNGTYQIAPASTDNDPFNLGDLSSVSLVPAPSIMKRKNNNYGAPNLVNQNQPCCKALYDFDPEQPGELAFKENNIIELTNKIDENWFEGRLDGITGHFPINYVQVITPLPNT